MPARADDLQSWHRLSLDLWGHGPWGVQWHAEGRWEDQSSRLHEFLVTPQVLYQIDPVWQAGVAYTLYADRDASGFNNEHRVELELNPHWHLRDWVDMELRNRLELRFREGPRNGTDRTRHRVQFSFPLEKAGIVKSIFLNNEIFFDYDRHQFNQNRLTPAGLKLQLNEHTSMRVFYLLQSTRTRAEWKHNHVIGTQLIFRLR